MADMSDMTDMLIHSIIFIWSRPAILISNKIFSIVECEGIESKMEKIDKYFSGQSIFINFRC